MKYTISIDGTESHKFGSDLFEENIREILEHFFINDDLFFVTIWKDNFEIEVKKNK